VAPVEQEAIYAKLSDILREVFDDEEIVARPDLTANQVDGWDSFAHLRLITTVERAFNVRFTASQVSALKNVGELAELIQSKSA
jgi:acyl carrier protein